MIAHVDGTDGLLAEYAHFISRGFSPEDAAAIVGIDPECATGIKPDGRFLRVWIPSPAEIIDRALAIREKWTEEERHRRAGVLVMKWTAPEVSTRDIG